MSSRVRGKATVNSKKVGGPTFVGPNVAPEFATAEKEDACGVPKQIKERQFPKEKSKHAFPPEGRGFLWACRQRVAARQRGETLGVTHYARRKMQHLLQNAARPPARAARCSC